MKKNYKTTFSQHVSTVDADFRVNTPETRRESSARGFEWK